MFAHNILVDKFINMKKFQAYAVIAFHVVILISETESLIIPYLIYAGVKNGWFKNQKSSSSEPVTTTTTTIATTTTEELPIDSVEYMSNSENPCGYGPLPAFNPRDEWFFNHDKDVPVIPENEEYVYSLKDVGGSNVFAHLLRSLKAMKNPNFYSNKAFFNQGKPKFNHYKIHRHLYNDANIPKNANIDADYIIGCTDDSTALCPFPTMSLCTSNGAILCVANHTSTAPCNKTVDKLPCVTSANHQGVWTEIPCVSDATVVGRIAFNLEDRTVVSKEKDEELRKRERENQKRWDKQADEYLDDLLSGKTPRGHLFYMPFDDRFMNRLKNRTDKMLDKVRLKLNPNQAKPTEITETTTEISTSSVRSENNFCVTIIALPGRKHREE